MPENTERADDGENGSSGHEELAKGIREIEENPKPFDSLTLFIVTLILFFSTGIVRAKISEIVVLILVVFLHELGHLAAMKMLGYKDVKMFFVPFFGAAVSGKTSSDSTVKSCFVSIMGPLPGILFGVMALAIYSLTNSFYLLKAAQVFFLLNAFNLLPIMPLDGGRYIDTLFVKNRRFRLAFALFGVLCFVGLGLMEKDIVIGIIAFFALMGSWVNFKNNTIADKMVQAGMAEKTVLETLENKDLFNRLILSLKESYPKLFSPSVNIKALHGHISHIVDTVRFVPAGWISKILLSVFYFGALAISLAVTVVFLAANLHEKIRVDKTEKGDLLINEKYAFGTKGSEVLLNKDLFYHGLWKQFGTDSTTVSATCEYVDGYRHGKYVELGKKAEPVEIAFYTRGNLDSIVEIREDSRKLILPHERSGFERAASWMIRRSQPRKSNYPLFEND